MTGTDQMRGRLRRLGGGLIVGLAAQVATYGCGSNPVHLDDTGPRSITTPTATAATALATTVVAIPNTTATTELATAVAPPAVEPPATSAAPTAVASPFARDALAGWPSAPLSAPDITTVPLLLPSVGIAGTTSMTRIEHAGVFSTTHDYAQFWFGTNVAVQIETKPGKRTPLQGDAVTVAPWDQSSFAPMADAAYSVLGLDDPSGSVTIWAYGLGRDEVTAIAASLTRRDNGRPGWDVGRLPNGLTPVHEGWALSPAVRTVYWNASGVIAEMSIESGDPLAFQDPVGTDLSATTVIDVSGHRAVAFASDLTAAVVWSPAPDVTVRFGLYGTVDQAIAIARSVATVDAPAWEAATRPEPDGGDGCTGPFC